MAVTSSSVSSEIGVKRTGERAEALRIIGGAPPERAEAKGAPPALAEAKGAPPQGEGAGGAPPELVEAGGAPPELAGAEGAPVGGEEKRTREGIVSRVGEGARGLTGARPGSIGGRDRRKGRLASSRAQCLPSRVERSCLRGTAGTGAAGGLGRGSTLRDTRRTERRGGYVGQKRKKGRGEGNRVQRKLVETLQDQAVLDAMW